MTHIHLASLFNCTLVIAPEGIFIVYLMFLFLRCYTLFAFVEAEIQSASVFVRSEIKFRDPVPLRDSDVASLLADVAHLYSRLPFATLTDPPIKYPSAPNIGRNGNAPSHFAVGRSAFSLFFSSFSSSISCRSWFSSLPRRQQQRFSLTESFAMACPNALLSSILSTACYR